MTSEQIPMLTAPTVAEEHELDDIPESVQPRLESWSWAEERCVRRCGLQTSETALLKAASTAVNEGTPFLKVAEF